MSNSSFVGRPVTPLPLQETDFSSDLLFAKVLTMVVLGMSSFILGVIPIKLVDTFGFNDKKKTSPKVSAEVPVHACHSHDADQSLLVSVLLCFGGGVLLFTTFLHLGPEVRHNMEELKEKRILPEFLAREDLHLADLIFCLGFFLVYFLDEAAHSILDSSPPVLEEEAILHRTMSMRRCARNSEFGHHRHHHKNGTLIPRVTLSSPGGTGRDLPENSLINVSVTSRHGLLSENVPHVKNGAEVSRPKSVSDTDTEDSTISGSNTERKKSFRGLFAILALSFHEVFEGLAVGLETNVQNVWYLFAAIATHKLVISFCMGVELLSTKTKVPVIIMYIFCFAVVTPIGIVVGIMLLLSDDGSSAETTILTFVLQGISSGTLLYVTFFEVLRREKTNAKSGFLQLLAVVTGFALMLLLQIISSHQHSHTHGHSDHSPHEHDHSHHHH